MLIIKKDLEYYFLDTDAQTKDILKVLQGTVVTQVTESVVLPRRGITSPWSSKAAELLAIFNFPVRKIWKGQVKDSIDLLLEEKVMDLDSYFKENLKKKKLKV